MTGVQTCALPISYGLTGTFEGIARGSAERIQAPVDIGIFKTIEMIHPFQNRFRLLGGGRIVHIDEGLFYISEYREFVPDFPDLLIVHTSNPHTVKVFTLFNRRGGLRHVFAEVPSLLYLPDLLR